MTPASPKIHILSAATCWQLPSTQTREFAGTAHTRNSLLAASAALWQDFYKHRLPPPNQPWWAHQTSQDNEFKGILWLDPSLPFFAGHFPGAPILPGVVQVHWAIEVAARVFERTPANGFNTLSRVKFKRPLVPETWLEFSLQRSSTKISLNISRQGELCTQGQLNYLE